ncbi:hypothetical protein ACTBQ7_005836, partial [Escherichia coli]
GGSEQHRHCGMIKKPPATGMDAGGGDTYGEKIKERYFRISYSGFLMKTVLIVNNNGKKL